MESILVTGGAGFVGSHACKALARRGFLPVTFDNLERGHKRAVKWGPLVQGDLRNDDDLNRAFDAWHPVAVMHFAAYAYVGESTEHPVRYYENNIGGSAKLIAACAKFGCNKIVFSSSCATYGIPASLPIREGDPQQPVNPYGYSKLVVERLMRDAETAYGIQHISLRYFNAAGCDPDGEIGECHEPETHLIPLVLHAAMGKRPSVDVFGQDYPTDDGTCIRDYVHVSDLADAHVAAIDWLKAGNSSRTFNLGNGNGFSVKQVVQTAQEITGLPIQTISCPRRAGDPPILISDSTEAREHLGWQPKFPTLRDQVQHAWHWLRKGTPESDDMGFEGSKLQAAARTGPAGAVCR